MNKVSRWALIVFIVGVAMIAYCFYPDLIQGLKAYALEIGIAGSLASIVSLLVMFTSGKSPEEKNDGKGGTNFTITVGRDIVGRDKVSNETHYHNGSGGNEPKK